MLRCGNNNDATNSLTLFPALALATYVGAEGEGESASASAGGEGETPASPASSGDSSNTKTYDEEYVKSLRAENAKYRTEARKTREDLDKLLAEEDKRKKAKMDDLERVQTERDEFEGRATAAETTARRAQTQLQVVVAAGKLNFTDPADAMAMLDLSEVDFDETGRPDAKAIEEQLTAIAAAKPYLLKEGATPPQTPGSGDGGPKPPAAPTDAFQKRIQEHQKTFENQGFIPIPQ